MFDFWKTDLNFALLRSLSTLQYFIFVVVRNKVQTRPKKYRGMVYYLTEKHMQKFRHFWRKKSNPKTSLSNTSLLHQAIQLLFFFFDTGTIQIDYSQQETAQLPPLEDFVHRITSHFVEITTYTKADGKLSANIGEVPPLIPPCQCANKVLNTEASKNSVYLTKKEKLNDVEGNNLFSCMHYFPPMRLYIRLYQSKLYLGSMAHF